MSDDPNAIKEMLKPLIAEARASGQWLYTSYHGLWFSPDDLEKENANGKFLWGAVNWRLRDPLEHLTEAETRLKAATMERDRIRQKVMVKK